jgi:hypothetical protein
MNHAGRLKLRWKNGKEIMSCRIWGLHGGGYEEYHLLGYDTVWSVEPVATQQTTRRHIPGDGTLEIMSWLGIGYSGYQDILAGSCEHKASVFTKAGDFVTLRATIPPPPRGSRFRGASQFIRTLSKGISGALSIFLRILVGAFTWNDSGRIACRWTIGSWVICRHGLNWLRSASRRGVW